MSKPEFVYVTYIETTPEKLWEALTVERVHRALLVRHQLRFGLEGRLAVRAGAGDGKVTDAGEILEADPPRRLSYTFVNPSDEISATSGRRASTFVLEPHGKLVKLTLTHEGFRAKAASCCDGISKGWPAILSSLKSMLETGQPLEIPLAALQHRE